jgi:hypothetical protein
VTYFWPRARLHAKIVTFVAPPTTNASKKENFGSRGFCIYTGYFFVCEREKMSLGFISEYKIIPISDADRQNHSYGAQK